MSEYVQLWDEGTEYRESALVCGEEHTHVCDVGACFHTHDKQLFTGVMRSVCPDWGLCESLGSDLNPPPRAPDGAGVF